MKLILFILISSGATLIVTRMWIFKSFRYYMKRKSVFLYELVTCESCTGFHFGWFFSIFINPLTGYTYPYASNVLCAFISSLCAFLIGLVVHYIYLSNKHLERSKNKEL